MNRKTVKILRLTFAFFRLQKENTMPVVFFFLKKTLLQITTYKK